MAHVFLRYLSWRTCLCAVLRVHFNHYGERQLGRALKNSPQLKLNPQNSQILNYPPKKHRIFGAFDQIIIQNPMKNNTAPRSRSASLSRTKVSKVPHHKALNAPITNLYRNEKSCFRLGAKYEQNEQNEKSASYIKTRHQAWDPEQKKQGEKKARSTSYQWQQGSRKTKRNQIQSLRSLLPDYLNVKFPQDITLLHILVNKIDSFLQNIPKKQLGQSVSNVTNYLKKIQNLQLAQHSLEQINFVMPGFYNFYRDPLKNIVIEMPKGQSRHLREQAFRKQLYELYMEMIGNELEPIIGTKQLLVKRTQFFYPVRKYRSQSPKTPPLASNPDLKQQFVQQILAQVEQKGRQQSQIPLDLTPPTPTQMTSLKQTLKDIYSHRKVSSMFKPTLISLLHQEQSLDMTLGGIITGLEILLTDGDRQGLASLTVNDNQIVNFRDQGTGQITGVASRF